MQSFDQLKKKSLAAIAACRDKGALDALRISLLGKKGALTLQLKQLGSLALEKRAEQGAVLNKMVGSVRDALDKKHKELQQETLKKEIQRDGADPSLPATSEASGSWHPISRVRRRIEDIFASCGYETILGPEIESDYYNFEALNFPPLHPARTLHDTFYFSKERVLRTHTSPVQIRAMENRTPPIKVICPGKTYRCDYDATHTPMFNQVEGIVIDKDICFADLKGTLQFFVNSLFGGEAKLRFRASYFPFTEPSAEVDILWDSVTTGNNLDEKLRGKWLEILGCGMVHPNVLRAGGIDPEVYSGFAFGMGIERMAMLLFGVEDIRLFYENDCRFLRCFA